VDSTEGEGGLAKNVGFIFMINVAADLRSSPAEEEHMDDLGTIVVVWPHKVNGVEADGNVHSLKRAEFTVDGGFVP
jgi:hypothetical protein